VIKKIDRLNAIEVKTEIFNQNKQKVIGGTAKVKIVETINEDVPESKETNDHPIALIVGASGGIGSALASLLAEKGYNLVLQYYSNKEKAFDLKAKFEKDFNIQVYIYQADIRNELEVSKMFDYIRNRLGGVNRMVHAATGPVPNISMERLEWVDYQKQLDIHVKAFFFLIKSFIKQCGNYGKIVGISSQTTDYPFSDLSPYTTAKAALEGMTRSLALDLSKNGIRLNMVSPGITETELNADLPEKARMLAAAKTPLKRLAQPEDVANAIAFLLSPESDYLTGETIRVNGGLIMK
jgi:3-oxoacyl-[acyl-carrier protein] reductase